MATVSAQKLFNNCSKDTLLDITNKQRIVLESEKPSKATLIKTLKGEVEDSGVNYLIKSLKKQTLVDIRDNLSDIDFTSRQRNNPNNKTVMVRRITQHISKVGVEKFFMGQDKSVCIEALVRLGYDAKALKGSSKADLAAAILSETNTFGLSLLFSGFSVNDLKDIGKELDLEIDSNSKAAITEAIIMQKDLIPERGTVKRARITKKKPALKKGVNYESIFQHYKAVELRDICIENDLSSTGRKKNLIDNILKALDKGETIAIPSSKKTAKKNPKKRPHLKSPTKPKKKARRAEPEPEPESEDESMEESGEESMDESGEASAEESAEESAQEESAEEEGDVEMEEADGEENGEEEELDIHGSLFCLSGSFPGHTKAEIQAKIEEYGGKVTPHLTKETDYLVVPNPDAKPTKKMLQANKWEITISGQELVDGLFEEGDEEEEE